MKIPSDYIEKDVMVMLKGAEVSIRGVISEICEEYIIVYDKRAGQEQTHSKTFIPIDSILAIKVFD